MQARFGGTWKEPVGHPVGSPRIAPPNRGGTVELDEVRSLYEGRPPFATVYLEARSPAEDSPQQVRLRWEEG